MREPTSNTETFDVFLCHNSEDKPEIRKIADDLSSRGLKPWLDEREIQPGKAWQVVLEEQIQTIKAAAVFVGKSGLGPWQTMEMRVFINEFVERKCPVIPVVLPSAKETPKLPILLKSLHWVDFRKTESDPLKQLIWGITGEKPEHQTKDSVLNDLEIRPEVEGKDLFPPKEKQVIELRLRGNVEEFSPEKQGMLVQALNGRFKIGEVKVTRAVAGRIRLYLELHSEDADKIYSANKEGQLNELGISEARLYPALAVPPDHEQLSQLRILLYRVKEYWVEGVLKHSLHNEVLISLGKRTMDKAVEAPWKYTVELPKQRRHLLLQNRNINNVFDATGLLLILGEPGSGKTTSLLELASALIVRAKDDPKERVPIVLNLSSWKKKQPLGEWIATELSAKYRVPRKIASSWLTNDYLVPLLDGLDEVQTGLQPDCVAAINEFIDENKPSGLVVCCRLTEYQWLPERLKLNGAICLESLTSEEVKEFLAAGGSQLAGLQQALRNDPVILEMAQTPLMLSIMSLAYEGVGGEALTRQQADSLKERREQIFSLYVERMFQRKRSITSPFAKEKIIGWLSWLAKKMKDESQTVFMVEGLQSSWLSSTRQQLGYKAVVTLSVGLIFGLISGLGVGQDVGLLGGLFFGLIIMLSIPLACLSASPLKNGVMSALGIGLVCGLIFGLTSSLGEGLLFGVLFGLIFGPLGALIGSLGIGSPNQISIVETMRWQTKQFLKKMISGLKIGGRIGLIFGVIFGLSVGVVKGLSTGLSAVLNIGLSAMLIFGLIGGAISGLLGGMTHTVKVDKTSPNQGIKLSMQNALIALSIVGLIFGLSVGLFGWLSVGQNVKQPLGPTERLRFALFCGLIFGLIGGLNLGGSAVLKHYSLRLIFWLNGSTPLRFIKFLDHCAKLILLKKVGGGYIFIHRTLLEYFAELSPQTTSVKGGAGEATSISSDEKSC